MPSLEFLCSSANYKKIYYDPIGSHAATHFDDTPNLKNLVIEVLQKREIQEDNLAFDINMERIVGTTDVVEVGDKDVIVYALRKNRSEQGFVPFVKSRSGEPNSYVSIYLIRHPGGNYILSSAWIGEMDDPPFPGEKNATDESKKYWSKHAFVWGSQEIQAGSETKERPW